MKYSYISKVGTRDINEDSLVCIDDDAFMVAVADGLGGHGHGEVASSIVCEAIKDFYYNNKDIQIDDFLKASIGYAQERLIEEQKLRNARAEMKTTLVALCCKDDKFCWGHVGDSRLYTFYKNKVKSRTLDHSIPQMLALSGEISDKKIRNHHQRNMLLRVLGIDWDSPKYELSEIVHKSKCQAFLLCSDGFWELIEEKYMCKLLKKSKTPEEWLEKMVEVVEKNGKNKEMDNYTAIAVFV